MQTKEKQKLFLSINVIRKYFKKLCEEKSFANNKTIAITLILSLYLWKFAKVHTTNIKIYLHTHKPNMKIGTQVSCIDCRKDLCVHFSTHSPYIHTQFHTHSLTWKYIGHSSDKFSWWWFVWLYREIFWKTDFCLVWVFAFSLQIGKKTGEEVKWGTKNKEQKTNKQLFFLRHKIVINYSKGRKQGIQRVEIWMHKMGETFFILSFASQIIFEL